jgi:hypothetical protein
MRERFDEGRARLSPEEKERVWAALRDALPGRGRARRWVLPALSASLGAVVIVALVLRTGHDPGDVLLQARPETSETRQQAPASIDPGARQEAPRAGIDEEVRPKPTRRAGASNEGTKELERPTEREAKVAEAPPLEDAHDVAAAPATGEALELRAGESGGPAPSAVEPAFEGTPYEIARRYLEGGSFPPRDAIDVEEFLVAFPRELDEPTSVRALSARGSAAEERARADEETAGIDIEAAPSPFGGGVTLLRVERGSGGKDPSLDVTFSAAAIERYRRVGGSGFERTTIDSVDSIDGPTAERGVLYEVVLAEGVPRNAPLVIVHARPGDAESAEPDSQVLFVLPASHVAVSFEQTTPSFRLDAAASGFGEILRGGGGVPGKDLVTVERIVTRLQEAGYRSAPVTELRRLVEAALAIENEAGGSH